ncbi:MAG: pyridoxamine 5'-phosphate oxidase [Chloroflexi bacterium]|nr:MAG: pyridoxamine 5'-phosphate oxidase [Chloroflexota bacterium]
MKMTRAEQEAFLTEVHVSVIAINAEGRGPVTMPIWYKYEPGGEIVMTTQADSLKAVMLRKAGRFTLCVQQETLPYKYVTVEGPVTNITNADLEKDIRPIAERYLAPERANRFVNSLRNSHELVIRMKPERWFSRVFNL